MTDYATLRTTMVDTQIRPSDVTKFTVIEAMLNVPREAFVPNSQRDAAYVDTCLTLDKARVVLDARTWQRCWTRWIFKTTSWCSMWARALAIPLL